MSGKDVLRLLLISYGFCRNIEISTYIGDGGWIGYEVSASNDDGIEYYEVDCEGLLFHIYEIQKFMRYENIEPLIIWFMATRNRLYKLHYLLRKKGNEVNVKDRTVYRRAKLLPAIEEKWMKELIENGYMVGNNLFAPLPNNNS